MPKHNGHANWSHWNVSLWLYNDENMQRMVQDYVRDTPNKNQATRAILARLPERTPDGARYSFSAVRTAIRDM